MNWSRVRHMKIADKIDENWERRRIWINISGHAGAFNVFILYFIMLISFAMIELNANDGRTDRQTNIHSSDSLSPFPTPAACHIWAHW